MRPRATRPCHAARGRQVLYLLRWLESQDSLQLDGRSGGGIEDKKRAGTEEASRRGKERRQDWRTGG